MTKESTPRLGLSDYPASEGIKTLTVEVQLVSPSGLSDYPASEGIKTTPIMAVKRSWSLSDYPASEGIKTV